MRIRQSLERGKWSNAKILVHSEVEFEHFTLVATGAVQAKSIITVLKQASSNS
jgi:hypothetical protein